MVNYYEYPAVYKVVEISPTFKIQGFKVQNVKGSSSEEEHFTNHHFYKEGKI